MELTVFTKTVKPDEKEFRADLFISLLSCNLMSFKYNNRYFHPYFTETLGQIILDFSTFIPKTGDLSSLGQTVRL